MAILPSRRERVFDFSGGPLQIVSVLDLPLAGPIHYEPQETVDCLPLAHGLALPQGKTAEVTIDGEPVAVLEVGAVNGKPACVAIRALPSHELTLRLFKRLPGIAKIVRFVAAEHVVRVVRADGVLTGERHVDARIGGWSMDAEEVVRSLDENRLRDAADLDAALAQRSRRHIDDAFLAEVAEVYREALASGKSTAAAITKRWPTSETNARRWVARARALGLLGEAPAQRRAGELPPKGDEHG